MHGMDFEGNLVAQVWNKLTKTTRSFFGLKDKIGPQGYLNIEHLDSEGNLKGEYQIKNGVTNEGKNLILDVMFNGATQIANNSWFIGLIDLTNYTALANGDTMASHSGWQELQAYTQSTRPAWGSGNASSQSTTNASPVTFDLNATNTVKGIFITSNSTKGGTTGKLWAHGLFNADVPVGNGDQLKVTYTVSC